MSSHVPVLPAEVVGLLRPEGGGTLVDCTVGLGGHAALLLGAGATRLVGLDRDPHALAAARQVLATFGDRVELVHADYRDVARVLDERGIAQVDGMLADLGLSSFQLESPGRGFSFQRDEPLDMRMDPSGGPTAADLLATLSERELADVIFRYGEERHSRPVARAIVGARARARIDTTGQLAEIVRRAIPRRGHVRIDPATRTFQAIRILVNDELEGLDRFLHTAAGRLAPAARLALITFHSLEDRIVKHTFRALAADHGAAVRVLTRKPIVPGEAELAANPRARSAKLRALEREA